MALEHYYDQFDPAQQRHKLLFRAGDGLQSRELNEMQSWLMHRISTVGDAVFNDGDLTRGADISVDADTGLVRIENGSLYLRGAVREVGDATLTIPVDQTVAIGVRFKQETLTELDDPTLRDPAVGTRNYNEPGAGRQRETLTWGWEAPTSSDGGGGQFHAVYTITNGVLENKTQPPALDAVTQALARYDREANGSYVASGMELTYLSKDEATNEFVLSLAEGTANVGGFKVEKPQATRLRWPVDPDTRAVTSEPHPFNDGGSGTLEIDINRAPMDAVQEITGTREVTETVTHGNFTGAVDDLANSSVVDVLEVTQGGTTYVEGTDYFSSGGAIDWSPGGAEPSPGSTYTVKYHYIDVFETDATSDTSVTVSGAVTGTTIFIDYTWKLPRIDVLAMDQDGKLSRFQGVSQTSNPQPPSPRGDLLALATIAFDWYSTSRPDVASTAVRAVPVSDLAEMQGQIDNLFGLLAIERLRNDANASDSSAKYGVFVDPFLDDDLRDAGIPQTAAVLFGEMTLPISGAVQEPPDGASATHTLAYVLTAVLEQMASTRGMKINPYMNFEPVPAGITLRPFVDNWTDIDTTWASAITRSFTRGSGSRSSTSTSRSTQLVSSTSRDALTIRQRSVGFTVEGFDAEEALTLVEFDGEDVTPATTILADAAGVVTGEFDIPPNIPTGSKQVNFLGANGSFGESTYTANGTIITETFRNVTTRTTRRWSPPPPPPPRPVFRRFDPLAQTFLLDTDTVIGGVDVWFDAIGDAAKNVIVQVRETTVGFPNQTVIGSSEVDMTSVSTNGVTRVEFDPTLLRGGREYALVFLTDDPDHALRVAELGKYDPQSETWITAQPYRIGVLLSSSNAVTWTAHQEMDLKFRLLACEFTENERVVNLGSISVSDTTDFIALAGVNRLSSDTDVTFVLRDGGGNEFRMTEASAVNLANRVTDTLSVEAHLRGSQRFTPVLFPGVQVLNGNLATEADYVSRAIPASGTFDMSVTFETRTPTGSTVKAFAQVDGGWTELTLDAAQPTADGFEERKYVGTGLAGVGIGNITRVKLEMTGTPAARPFVQALRAIVK